MNIQNETLEALADQLANEALHALGEVPLDDLDDYATQCDYAGCFPWLADFICAHPHDSVIFSALHASEATDVDLF